MIGRMPLSKNRIDLCYLRTHVMLFKGCDGHGMM